MPFMWKKPATPKQTKILMFALVLELAAVAAVFLRHYH